MTLDLIVAGAGGGTVGAIRAARSGLSVLLIEASEHYLRGSNTAMSTAMVPGAGSRFQAEAGVLDSPERFVADVSAKTHGEADVSLATALAAVSAPLVEWMADDLGLPMQLVTDFDYPGHSSLRCHTVPGRAGAKMLAMLADVAARTPGLDMLVPARLSAATPDDEGGWRVVVDYPDGTQEEIQTRALLLATNGFGADPALVAEHIPEIAGAVYHGSDQSRGDALRIGRNVGAGTAFLDAYQGHGALATGAMTLAGWALVMNGGFIVNAQGERFADESQGYSEFAALELRQPDHTAVIVFDQRIRELCTSFDDYRQTEQSGVVRWADSPHELAQQFDLDPATLAATTAQVGDIVAGSAVDGLGRAHWPQLPLTPPYAGVRVQPALFHTQGGLTVDGNARVLDSTGVPIKGLYAAGGAAMGISGHGAAGYLAGNGLLSALGLAYLAADHLAADHLAADVLPAQPVHGN
jgi:fumarate reductase flavoprotein subunit